VNIYSTVVIGLGFPLVVAAIGGVGSLLPGAVGQFFSAAGTWVYEGIAYPTLTFGFTFFWLIVTFVLTVRYEATVLEKRWKARSVKYPLSAAALSWRGNAITYGGLLLYFLLTFTPMFF
jgi:hypothetical protein